MVKWKDWFPIKVVLYDCYYIEHSKINSVLTNMVLYMISLFLLPKRVLHKLDYYWSKFFWQRIARIRNIDSWSEVRFVGWEFMTFRLRILPYGVNGCLSFFTEDGAWQILLKRKYIGSKLLSDVVWKPGDLHFWAGLMLQRKTSFSINDGLWIQFWEDICLVIYLFANNILHCIT
jgi:hypothetical protein